MDVERSNSFLSFSALMVELKNSTWKIHFCSLEKCHIKNVTWLCHMVMWHEQLYVENGWSFKILVKMDHKWISLGRFGPNFWLLVDLLALVGSYRTSEITKRTIPCSFLVSSCLKSLHSQTPNPFIPLGNMYSLFCGWRINTGGQRDETVYGKINCFLLLTNHFWRHNLSSLYHRCFKEWNLKIIPGPSHPMDDVHGTWSPILQRLFIMSTLRNLI